LFSLTSLRSSHIYTLSLHDALPIYFSGFTGIFFILTLFFQNGVGYTALAAGLGLTSFAIGSTLSSGLSGRHVVQAGRKLVVWGRSEEHTSELQSRFDLVCRLLLEQK